MRSAALIGLNGSIEWFSFLHFDSPRIFDSLLDEDNVHILATTDGIPVDFTFLPGRSLLFGRMVTNAGRNVSICLILM